MSIERIIRKLPQRPSTALEERPSTVQWVLVLWAALVTILVIALGGFDDTRLLHNGFFRLAAVAASWGLLAWAWTTPGRWMAQRLRLAVAASLALHTLLALALVFAHLTFLLTQPEPDIDRQLVVEPVDTPRLVEIKQPVQNEEPVFDKPVPTERLAAQLQPQATTAKALTSEPVERKVEPPELATSQVPQSLAERRPRTALTHRAKSPGQRSRQPDAATLATTLPESVVRPSQLASTVRSELFPAAEVAKATSRPTDVSSSEPKLDALPAAPSVGRRTVSNAPQVTQQRPLPQRRQFTAEVVDAAIAEATPNISTPETNQLAAEPTRLERPNSSIAAPHDVPEPQRLQATPPSAIARRDTRAVELPLAASPTPLDRRQEVSVAEAATLTPETRQLAEVTRTKSTTQRILEPVAATITRAQPAITAASDVEEPTERITPMAVPQPERRQATSLLAETRSRERQPRRLAEAALSETEPSPEPLVAAVPRAETREQSSSPTPRVLADSRGGTGSLGDGLNAIDGAPAAPTYSAPYAAAAAGRTRSTQTERGPALRQTRWQPPRGREPGSQLRPPRLRHCRSPMRR